MPTPFETRLGKQAATVGLGLGPVAVLLVLASLLLAFRSEGTGASELYRSAVLDDRPVAYWRLDDPPGSAPVQGPLGLIQPAADSSGNNATGSYLNGVTLGSPGPFEGEDAAAASFDGVDDRVAVPDLQLGRRFTLELWAYPLGQGSTGDASYGTLVGYDNTHRIAWNATAEWLLAQFDGDFVSTRLASSKAWHHIVYSYDGTTERFFLDGQPAGSHRTNLPVWRSSFRIGDYDGTNYLFNGRLAEVAVYNRPLTAQTVREHFSAGQGRATAAGRPAGER